MSKNTTLKLKMKGKYNMICYHHNDLDGKAAAFCVHTYKPKTIIDTPDSYFQCTYDDKFDKHTEKDDVLIVDLSISPSTYSDFLEVCRTARTVTWIDHHKSSIDIVAAHKDELQHIKNLTYFVSDCACGAALTYAYFNIPAEFLKKIRLIEDNEEYNISAKYINGAIDVTASKRDKKDPINHFWNNFRIVLPKWLYHIDDYDCWKKIDGFTDYFVLGCDSNNTAFTIYNRNEERRVYNRFWDRITDKNYTYCLIQSGESIYDYIHSRYHRELKHTFEWTYEGTTFICKNGTGNSWCFEHLIAKYPAVILFYYDGSSGKWKYSVFSDESSTYDCKTFCEKFGGGGHLHAAGFSTEKLIFTSPEYSNISKLEPVIFLGGTCNDDPWREEFIKEWKDTTKELPECKNIELFNPVVDDWTEECKIKEDEVKKSAFINLFVITPNIKGYYSIAEAVECANNGNNKTIFAVYDKYGKFDKYIIKSFNAIGQIVEAHGGAYIETDNMHSLIAAIISSI